jgi:uncharacterized protein YdcH (DUF465 family)
MTAGVEIKSLLLESDDEFKELAARHRDLEKRLTELSGRNHLSEPERFEEVTLKKRKLQLKDRMEDILRRYRERPSIGGNAQAPARG